MNPLPNISFVANTAARTKRGKKRPTDEFAAGSADAVRLFHRSLAGYKPTPLWSLGAFASRLGVANVWIKDESPRFGLNAFKVLGASYAIANTLAESLAPGTGALSFDAFCAPAIRARLRKITVCTATDGNHGRAVAWAAEQLGCNAAVYMPKGSSRARVDAVESHGAAVTVVDGNYDDTVDLAASVAGRNGWMLIQDTAWPGYERVPVLIMQGYLTILGEALEQLNGEIPTHVFVQAGVGSLAGAMQAQLFELFGDRRPVTAVVEPDGAACCFASISGGTGTRQSLTGDHDTIMAGLACGTPSTAAWDILRDYTDGFFSCSDDVTTAGMRILHRPAPGDPAIVSGESGAVTAGLLATLMEASTRSAFAPAARALGLDAGSKILLVSTEGATDPVSYNKIVGI